MATQNDSNELRVERDADIENDLTKYNIDIATVVFEASQIERVLETSEATSGEGDSDAATTGAIVEMKDGKAANIIKRMVPITTAMEIPAKDSSQRGKKSGDKKKEQQEKEDKTREEIGE